MTIDCEEAAVLQQLLQSNHEKGGAVDDFANVRRLGTTFLL